MSKNHGSLETTIMNAVWHLEENNLSSDITVCDVFDLISKTSAPRAYTTIKTVMDRLVDKDLLVRFKKGKKFAYSSVHSRLESASLAIKNLANTYFDNDWNMLDKAVKNICDSSKIFA